MNREVPLSGSARLERRQLDVEPADRGENGRDDPIYASPIVIGVLVGLLGLVVIGDADLALVGAIVLPLLAFIVTRPQRGVLLLAALVPFDGVLAILPVPGVAVAWKEMLVGVTLVATFLCPAAARAGRGRARPGWVLAAAAFVVVGLVWAVVRHDLQGLIGLKTDYFYVLVPIAIWRCPLAARERDRLVSILMVTGFVCAAVGLVQQVVGGAALNQLGYPYNETIRFAGGNLRSFSTFDQPFPFALFLMVVLLVCVPVALARPERARNRMFLLATPVYALGLLSAFVRSALLGLAIGLLYLGLRRYRVLLLGFPLALVAVVLVGTVGGATTGPFSSGESLRARSVGWEENVVQLGRHPLGAGIGEVGGAAAKAATFTTVTDQYQPDNYYFKTVYELGVLGLWMFVLLLVAAFLEVHHAGNRIRGPDQPLLDGIGAQVLAAATASLVSSYFEIFPVDVMFWLLLGVAATVIADERMRAVAAASSGDAAIEQRA
jgi:hypothetical protein